ncbi:hypothetical protein K461DRAFT_224083 [Myriangium duriaei CBS 260.36]|uniref:VPS9 domain-containing protein n=1 Tax=Myriangium duriaei CBS 260.36 TaxID=1168546 RepID=A0A9P4J1G1_9PEZI|nr:hypothetical protein K461DRAFT_224083 [Myriangium duriaei CBS 260.36]
MDAHGRSDRPNQQEALGELPIEIKSFTERFLKSLSVKSHAAPLTIDSISDLFQDFYIQAESHISTHIAALTTRISRERSPTPSTSSRTSGSGRSRQRGATGQDDYDSGADQQMLTASEITDKRKARRMLELQRSALEEAVEQRVCEKIYDKIYRHRSTDDEERDAKLRSKTAALSLIGIGLNELHVNVPVPEDGDVKRLQADIYERLAPARDALQCMDLERYPLGKLQHLVTAHQSIVETLAHIFPSTSSADEVLPTLIYTLVSMPPESLNVASNLHFIQLFRSAAKMDGEAAYCLVNLEASISFLETVDLSSLRTDVSGIPASNGSEGQADREAKIEPDRPQQRVRSLTADLPAVSNPSQKPSVDDRASPIPESPIQGTRPINGNQRRISHMLQAQAERIEAGRDNFMQSADQAIDSINSTLENSFKFLFGRLKEQEKETQGSPVMIPRTLDDARRLVKSPIQEEHNEALMASHLSLASAISDDPLRRRDDKPNTFVGRLTSREVSADSNKSAGVANKRSSLFGGEDKTTPGTAEAMGNFVNALNPLSRFGVPSFPKFGRATNSPAPEQMAEKTIRQTGDRNVSQEVDLNAAEALAQLKKARPPVKRFLEVKDAKELRVGEIDELLKDYRRLAELLGEAITS